MPDIARTLHHRGVTVPTFLYGTAWKEDRTQALTEAALSAGFLGIDTANQRRHYYEAGVGKAVRAVLDQGSLKRGDLFLQTKFTYAAGQDHRLPFDPRADHPFQVRQSLASSLDHLQTSYVDSFILHGPAGMHGFGDADRGVWRTMEQLHKDGVAKLIGVSNVGYDQLAALIEFAEVAPAFVQNRCFARAGWDARIRAVCNSNGVLYQGFSLLTANAAELNRGELHALSRKLGRTLAQIVFRFSLQAGMIPLTGTTSPRHMQEDLAVYDFELHPSEVETIENAAFH
ncbi:MAG: aldo/keto reductase [Desulfobacteraceae bacterium]|nr:MAG: aldo/keto reductase [Desulfobacteraceae bacterium]